MSDAALAQRRLAWCAAGEAHLLALLATVPDLRVPSLLPGWSRAHLVAHLIGNADALGNLVRWARTGEPTPMYANPEARSNQIERDSERDAAWLLDNAAAASGRLGSALAGMTDADFDAPVRTAQGREVAGVEIAWLRVRESVIHALDLDVGAGLDWCPSELVDALLTDIAATVGGREGCPAVLLVPHDRDQTWRLGPVAERATEADAATVTGSAAELLTWVAGRSDVGYPTLPRWL